MKLNDKDLKILKILRDNARAPLKDIGKEVGLSIPSVSARIKNLVKNGFIKGFRTLIDYGESEDSCQLVLEIAADKSENITEIGKELASKPNICLVLNVTGEYDLLVFSKCKDTVEGAYFLNELRKIKGVSKIKSHYVLQKLKLELE